MKLPSMKYSDSITRQTQFKFGGYNHTPSARDGDIFDMKNIASDDYPLIGQRKKKDIFDGLSGAVFSGVKFWMGNKISSGDAETQYGKIFLGTELEINQKLREDDIIEISVGGEYLTNSGQYTVRSTSERNGGIYIEVSKTFEVSDGYSTSPVTTGNTIKKNDVSLEIKIAYRDGEPYFDEILAVDYDGALYYVTKDGSFYYDGLYRGQLSAGEKSFAKTGNFIYILPDNAYYRISDGVIVQNEVISIRAYNYGAASDGSYIETSADMSGFKSGDAVVVTATTLKGNKYTFEGTVSSVSYSSSLKEYTLNFTENIITKAGYTLNDITDGDGVWGWYRFVVTKNIPDLKYICADSGRIWGCSENTIYCTSFANPLGWYEYAVSQAGNDADIAWSIEPFDVGGEFTGCCIYNDRPMFFTEDKIYKVYGQRASDFQLLCEETPGVKKGSDKSISVVNSVLFFHSPQGVIRYSGNYGVNITDGFGEDLKNAVSGSDAENYYITAECPDEKKTFVYNCKKGLWSVWDNSDIKVYYKINNKVFTVNFEGVTECINPNEEAYPEMFKNPKKEADFESYILFGNFYADTLGKKAPSKLFFRFITEENSEIELFISYDDAEFEHIKTISEKGQRTFTVPVIPKRCDRFKIKIKGCGTWKLHMAGYEYYVGTER